MCVWGRVRGCVCEGGGVLLLRHALNWVCRQLRDTDISNLTVRAWGVGELWGDVGEVWDVCGDMCGGMCV